MKTLFRVVSDPFHQIAFTVIAGGFWTSSPGTCERDGNAITGPAIGPGTTTSNLKELQQC